MWYRNSGFTLVEMILVIVVMGILATVTTSYLGLGARMYAESSDRDKLLSQSRFAVERMVRELRNVVPNSVRVDTSGNCIEFMPLLNAGRYVSIPVTPVTGTSINIFSNSPAAEWNVLAQDYLAIYPTEPTHIYDPALGRTVRLTGATNTNPIQFTFPSTSFPVSSPSNRLYIFRSPVSYCVQGNQLFRYGNYALQALQPVPGSGLANGVLMAEGLNNPGSIPYFVFDQAVLSRNSVVHLFISFGSGFNDNLFFNQEVHIPNVP
ncbi:MAG: prepilin-type N-terminal cleavage/methylation domain-containing protein [Gammaproteobacteria bacterium]|nr:prepilin-type N-terminal cleavage/methylation domain-containing protein [Gammaproteobacteria bacterium]MBU2056839.1 prepilin-type N-terminal cleavage/methylation domain-containing protein [Gammaproteobacteria bacterium]MBU2174629.1 prepilin-type N-terminal cleavage/methylation domain-containing protein [Gammaproteobacteria bacterium]MBU2248322.1 prepilin-type N-terminal cleavage/methylation domain-containing protein [Gammaproteobacteria bacterium]MBU2346191.1 prepilin-type N-terminal cleavag